MKAFALLALAIIALAVVAPQDEEIARLRAHFDTVDAELRAADVSALSPAQRASRERLIGWLREYRDAGAFPRNDRFATYEPFFRDSRGVLCAMAYLIERSGHGAFVDRIARARNNAYIRELADDPALIAWLRDAGLSVAEAARIQPAYMPPPEERDIAYRNTSIALGALSLTTVAWNLGDDPSRASAWTGAGAGLAGVLLGASEVDNDNDDNARVAKANLVIGLVATGAALRAFKAQNGKPPALTIAPALLPGSDTVGLGVFASF